MSRGFLLFLLMTGGLSVVVIAMPGLVVAGMMVLIIPGLILAAPPTLFLWCLTYTILWFAIRWAYNDIVATFGAALTALAILVAIPLSFNAALDAQIGAERAGDRESAAPIALRGLVELRAPVVYFGNGGFRRISCDFVCHAILYTPGVDGVILVDASGDKNASAPVQLKLEKQSRGCASDETEQAYLADVWGPGQADKALTNAWMTRQAEGECIVRQRPRQDPDFRVTLQVRTTYGKQQKWQLRAPVPSLRRLVIERIESGKAELLLQRSFAWSRALYFPLTVLPEGDLSNFSFGWGRRGWIEYKGPGHFVPIDLLRARTGFAPNAELKGRSDALRVHLTAAMRDPRRAKGDAGFALAPSVLEDIARNGPRPEDRALVVAMVRDPRVVDFHRLWDVSRRFGDGLPELRDIIVERLLSTPFPYEASDDAPNILGAWLKSLPEGSFAEPTAEQAQLLADTDRRGWADGLVRRLSDRGPVAAPMLVALITDRDVREAAIGALCTLGPAAASVRPQIEAKLDSHLRNERRGQIMLARLGKPIESFRSPPNHSWSDKQLQDSLRARLGRFDPKRDCD
jgi:hypothetical protein